MWNIAQYSLGEKASTALSLLYTKLKYRKARLIRMPIYLRGGKHMSFEEGLTLGHGCRFDLAGSGKTLHIGKNCHMNDRVHIVAHENVTIGDDVLMASNIFISDTSHGSYKKHGSSPFVAPEQRELVTNPVVIGSRVWIGEGACILPGTNLGDGCVVGANAVVTKSFPENSIIGGVPAKLLKQWCEESGDWSGDSD